MIKTESAALFMLRRGAKISRKWGGFRIGSKSLLPKLVVQLEEAGKIKRVDDGSSRVGEEWGIASEMRNSGNESGGGPVSSS